MKFRLSTRLVLSVILIEIVMLSVLVWNSVRLIGSSHAEVLEHHISQEANLLANLLAPGLAVNDRAILLDALSLVEKRHDIVYATVLDANENTMATVGQIPEELHLDKTYADAEHTGIFNTVKEISLSGQRMGTLKIGYATSYVVNLIDQTRWQNTFIAAIEIALSILVTLLVGYLLTRSLRQLEEGTKALVRGDLEHRIDLNSRDEMGDLARSFNKLATHLKLTRAALTKEHHALEKQTQKLRTLLDGVDAVIIEVDPVSYCFRYVSREAENLLGYPVKDWLQTDFVRQHIHPEDLDSFNQQVKMYFAEAGTVTIDFRMFNRNGGVVEIRSINTLGYDTEGELTCRGLLLDVTEQKQNEKRIAYLAEHDALTGLFNRRRFQEELERSLEYADRFKQDGALMFIDLDQFKYINDTQGHQAGDEYLCVVARRLSANLRKVDVLGRLGGDEFGIILPNIRHDQIEQAAENILHGLVTDSNGTSELETPVTASMGIVLFPFHGTVSGNLLAKADAAMYSAKDKGRNTFHIYSEDDKQLTAMHAKLQWEQRIRHALEEDLFVLHYQPVFKLDNRHVSHYEVLLRMQDGEGGLIPPGAFLEIAERFGMIRDIDRWVLQKSIQVQGDSRNTDSPVCLAINLSGRHFGNPQVLEWIRQFIDQSNADPNMLIFEITETAAVENISHATRFTDSLHAMGCRVALDDFGIGFSSFHYLKHLPVDMIKLDGSFIRHLASDRFDQVFVKAMSEMARGMGIKSIAEFIETEEVVTVLMELGVHMGQGFHLARPNEEFVLPCDINLQSDFQSRSSAASHD